VSGIFVIEVEPVEQSPLVIAKILAELLLLSGYPTHGADIVLTQHKGVLQDGAA
jgi:hypothetical protein